jgi:hypothetical protein
MMKFRLKMRCLAWMEMQIAVRAKAWPATGKSGLDSTSFPPSPSQFRQVQTSQTPLDAEKLLEEKALPGRMRECGGGDDFE